MRLISYFAVFVFFAAVVLSGCSRTVEEPSQTGLFLVELNIEEGVPRKGKNVMELLVLDGEGKPVEGAEFHVTPWMPEMEHGTPWDSRVNDLGEGRYRTNVPLTMGGHWEIRFDIRAGERKDTVVFDFPGVKE